MSKFPEGYRLGPYRVVRLVGEGGMGAVYEARQETLDRRVAVKTLHADFARNQEVVARFFTEAKVLSRLEHPCIVQVFDFGKTEDGTSYLAMEFLRGESLSRRLRQLTEQNRRLPVPTALQIAWQVADVLAVAHSQGIVHRDLKPENLMLVADPIAPGGERVKLLDFGIAKLTGADNQGAVKTNTHAVMGTPMYMSPEQCSGAGGVDAKTDVYSLGCVLYEILAGRPPFQGDGPGELIGKHLFHAPPALSSLVAKLSPQVSSLVHRMIEKDKKQRISISAAADELGQILSKMTGGGPVVRSLPPAKTDPDATRAIGISAWSTTLGHLTGQRGGSSRKTVRVLVAGAVVAALGVATFLFWGRGSTTSLPAAQPPAVPPSPAAKALVRWHIETSPANAAVLDEAGQTLGVTPWTQSAVAIPGKRSLRLHLDGYSDIHIAMDGGANFDEKFPLTPSVPMLPAPIAKPPASPLKRPAVRPASPTSTPKPVGPQSPAQPKGSKIGFEE